MADPEAPEEEIREQAAEEPAEATTRTDVGLEEPEADAVEQQQALREARSSLPPTLPAEADEADVADQSVEVELDEEEYR